MEAPLHLKQEFPSIKAFKTVLLDWAVRDHFEIRISKSQASYCRANCRNAPACPFSIRCNWYESQGVARITVFKGQHTCTGSDPHTHTKRSAASRISFLLEAVPKFMEVGEETKPEQIMEAILVNVQQTVTLQQCRRVKRYLLESAKVMQPPHVYAAANPCVATFPTLDPALSVSNLNAPSDTDMTNTPGPNPNVTPNGSGMSAGRVPPPSRFTPAPLNFNPPAPYYNAPTHNNNNNNNNSSSNGNGMNNMGNMGNMNPSTSQPETPLGGSAGDAVRCPFCINPRWLRTVKQAVDHMSTHIDMGE